MTRPTAGDAGLGSVVKDAKEQLRALPDPLSYGLLRYLNPDIELPEHDPPIGFNYLGRLTTTAAQLSDQVWRIAEHSGTVAATAAATAIALTHTIEINAATTDTSTGPQLHAHWTWAPSTLTPEHIHRLNQLWFQALTGICTHVHAGGGGLTPSDIAPPNTSTDSTNSGSKPSPASAPTSTQAAAASPPPTSHRPG
nr:hypothetical protein [Mycolicibacterium novocastrense]